jgi:excisionase family DNA binding protein
MSCLELSPCPETREGVVWPRRRLMDMSEQSEANPRDPDPPLMDAHAVAALLGVPSSWVYAETRAGRLPHVRVGRYRRFRRAAIQSWVEDHEKGPVR